METFLQHLNQHLSLTAEDESFLREHLRTRDFPRGEMLLSEGEVSKTFFFNAEGIVRLFYLREGEERTAYFYPEGTFISAYESFVRQEPSKLNLQAMERTILVEISFEAAAALLQYSNKFDVLARIAMEDELISHQRIIAALLTLSPEERYAHLLEENPAIFQRVPQRHIASYLGVKPESLSRIKKRATRNKS